MVHRIFEELTYGVIENVHGVELMRWLSTYRTICTKNEQKGHYILTNMLKKVTN